MDEEISVEAANGAIDSLVKEIHKLQEHKTPTKEQINEILDQMQKRGLYWDGIDYEDEYAALRFIITEWEKIRNKPN